MAIFGGNYYSSKNGKTGDILTFKDAGAWVESQFKKPDGSPKKQFQITVGIGKEEYVMNLNGTSINNIIPVYGRDSALWTGKEVKVEIVNALVAGKMKPTIILHPIEIIGEDRASEVEFGPDEQ